VQYIVIGTDHKLQKADNSDTGLRDLLEGILASRPNVVLVAEEVKADEDVRTFGRELVGDAKWLPIDMNKQQRENHGIYEELLHPPNNEQDADGMPSRVNPYLLRAEGVRENFWLDQIFCNCQNRKVSEGVIVITCGVNHVPFLAEKITARGHQVIQTHRYIPYDLEKCCGVFRVYP
jgi:hypothetical protein